MKGLFPQYDYTASAAYAETWETALFVFDTNVLLNLYRYQERTCEELLETLAKLSRRIWIPHHVALEFQRNRLTVIAAQGRRFSDIRKVIEKAKSDLAISINNLQLTKRHTLIDPEPLISGFDKLTDDFLAKLDGLKESQQTLTAPDPIKIKLEDIFDGKVGSPFSSQEEIDKQNKLADVRYKAKIPPGFKDNDKDKDGPDEFSHNGLIYKRKFGDHIVWSQLLSHAATEGIKKLIFVTDDAKEDWWEQVEFDGPKTVGPRAELIEEAGRVGKIDTFLMYKPEQFLKFAQELLKADISEETLTEVRDISSVVKLAPQGQPHDNVMQAVLNWVARKTEYIVGSAGYPDIIGVIGGARHGFEIKTYPPTVPDAVIANSINHAYKGSISENLDTITLVFVVKDNDDANIIFDKINNSSLSQGRINYAIGVCGLFESKPMFSVHYEITLTPPMPVIF